MMPVALGIVSSAVAVAAAVYLYRVHGWLSTSVLSLVSAALFVVVGMTVLGTGSEPWSDVPVLVTSSGLLILSAGLMATVSRRRYIRSDPAPESGPESAGRWAVIAVVFGLAALYFILIGQVPILQGLGQLVSSGGVVTPGLTNTARVSRDIYVNPEASYVPLQGLLEIFRYFGCITTAIIGLDWASRRATRNRGLTVIIVSVGLIVATGQRWPLMYLIAGCALASTLLFRFSRKLIAPLAVGGGLVAVVLSLLLGRTTSEVVGAGGAIVFGITDLVRRILVGYVEIPFASYGIEREALLPNGPSWVQNFASYLPGPGESYPVTFYRLVTSDTVGFTAAPDIWTEGWINAGAIGVVASSLFLVLVSRGSEAFTLRALQRECGVTRLAVVVPVCIALAFTPFTGFVFALGSIIVALATWMVFSSVVLLMGRRSENAQKYPRHQL